MSAVLLTRVSFLQHQGLTDQIRELVFRSVRKLSAVYIPVAMCLCVLGREFLITIYTAKYVDSFPILMLNALLLPLSAFIAEPVFRAHFEHRYTTLKIRSAMLIVLVVLAVPGIHRFGMIGAMGAYVISVAIERFWLFGVSMRILNTSKADWLLLLDLLKFFGSAVCAGLAVMVLKFFLAGTRPQVILLTGGLLFCLAYLLVLAVTGALDPGEQDIINRLSSKYLRFEVFRAKASD